MARGPTVASLQQRLVQERLIFGFIIAVLVASLALVTFSRSGDVEVFSLLSRSAAADDRGAPNLRPQPGSAAAALQQPAQPGTGEAATDRAAQPGGALTGGAGAKGAEAPLGDGKRLLANLSASFPLNKENQPKFVLKHLSKAGGTFSNVLLRAVVSEGVFLRTNYDDAFLDRVTMNHHFVAITMRNPCDWYISWAHGAPKKVWGYHNPTFGPNPLVPMGYKTGPLTPEELHDFVINARSPEGHGFLSWYIWQLVLAPECNHFLLRKWRNETFRPDQTYAACANSTRVFEDWKRTDPKEIAHCYIFQETAFNDWRVCLRAWQRVAPWARDAVNWTLFEAMAANSTLLDERFRKIKGEGEFRGKAHSGQGKRRKSCSELMEHGDLGRKIRKSDPWLFEKFGYSECCTPSSHVLW